MARDRGMIASPLDVADVREQLIAAGNGMPDDSIRRHLRTLGAPDLGPDVCGVDVLDFRCRVSIAGVVTQAAKQTLPGGFWAELWKISAWMEAPLTEPDAAALISFTVKDGRRSGNLFSTDWYVASLFSPSVGPMPVEFKRGLYRFDPGSDITVKFTTDQDATDGYDAQVNTVKTFGVTMHFNLYAVEGR